MSTESQMAAVPRWCALGANYQVQIHWQAKDGSHGAIHHIQSKDPVIYRDVGRICHYRSEGDLEICYPHWVALCFVNPAHLTDELLDLLERELPGICGYGEPYMLWAFPQDYNSAVKRHRGKVFKPGFKKVYKLD